MSDDSVIPWGSHLRYGIDPIAIPQAAMVNPIGSGIKMGLRWDLEL
jgi:hypothetical protein